MWHLNNSSQKLNLKYESPASHPWVTRLLRSRAIESPASRWKMRVPREAKLSRDDRSFLYHGLAISNTCSHAKNHNDPIPITWSKLALHEDAFFAVAILGGGWLQSPASDGAPCLCEGSFGDIFVFSWITSWLGDDFRRHASDVMPLQWIPTNNEAIVCLCDLQYCQTSNISLTKNRKLVSRLVL